TKTAVALLYDEESENAYDVRLKLTKEVLTIQKQDVVCVGGSHQGRNAPSSPSSPIAKDPRYEKRWLDTLSVPLSMARISRYKAGAEKLRWNAFEVLALDGVSSGVLRFYTAQDGADWLRAVSANIRELTLQNMKMANKCCSPSDQVVHMGWVNEKLQGADSSQTFRPKFLALKGPSFYVFSTPPVSTFDWVRAERTYHLCEVLFKVHKFWLAEDCWLQANLYLGLQDFDFEDQRPYCFSVMAGHGKSHVFNVELGSELAVWEKSFQRATFMEVQRTGNVLWRFKFSQLKGSSDDGKTRVKLLFQNLDTKQIETKELEFQDLTAVLHCIHSFLAAKVASVDPGFMDSQSLATKYMYNS
uniref:Syntrophin gamma 2 n=1 Tax=Mandrillus leucophaeus TaxID=9568 RepID=A0A2K5XKN1_MANLE